MKKILSCLLILSILFTPPTIIMGSETSEHVEYEYFEDGSYMMSIISQNDISTFSTSTLTGSRTSTYYNADNEPMWYIKVTGTFTYGNGTSSCTSSSIQAESYNSAWKLSNKTASKSGNTATASATAKQYFAFVPIKTIEKTVSLTCSSTGVLS